MTESEGLKEQRKQKRFSLKELVSGFCRTPDVGIAILMDVGVGGVAFQYTQDLRDSRDLLKDSIKLDLFKIQPFHSITEIECEVVYDTVLPWQVFLPDTYQLRRCGVEFSHLSEDQHRRLDSFIKEFTAEES